LTHEKTVRQHHQVHVPDLVVNTAYGWSLKKCRIIAALEELSCGQVFQASTASVIFSRFVVVWENLKTRWRALDRFPRIGRNCAPPQKKRRFAKSTGPFVHNAFNARLKDLVPDLICCRQPQEIHPIASIFCSCPSSK
jgi:hypothetical protein